MAEKEPWKPFHYTPSATLAIIFAALFGATTLLHTFQLFKKRTWYLVPLILGGYLEVIGFIARYFSRANNFSILAPFLIQAIFILIAPTLFAASIYIILGRIILLVDGERYSWVRQRHLTWAFVMGDVLSLNLQSNGGGLTSGRTPAAIKVGEILIILGLFAQLAFFGLFIAVAAVFHYRLVHDRPVKKHVSFRWARPLAFWRRWSWFHRNKVERPNSSNYASHGGEGPATASAVTAAAVVDASELPWKRHIVVLYVTSVLVLVRSVFRLVEYIQGKDGYLLSREVYLYACDAALMVVVLGLFNLVHPSQISELYERRVRGREEGVVGVELEGLRKDGGRGEGAGAEGVDRR
ncbi:RTA1 like protein-domain-containing protein [Dendryphion nanum]|uniref:RTA1 like protein-domain-containing protein n=1 Tax=Dendryphion nanum TaxID=256645 RepID=A0A9P9IPG4_9PLEO|nr:RTA1 like protein-domain-containing protein [Dendryphion nanum]